LHYLGPDPTRFPPVDQADEDGILAVGGDLSVERLVQAYQRGIFPWYSEGLPILWHCPDPRFVLEPAKLHVPRSLRKVMNRGTYQVRFDTAFEGVIEGCARTKRPGQRGTWITRDMRKAYTKLFEQGLVHTAEAWRGDELVGGLYGVSLGGVFFGESMFAQADDASKVAFATQVEWMRSWGIGLIDCQQQTEHLARFGAEAWPRARFVAALQTQMTVPTHQGRWTLPPTAVPLPEER
jgi:leucyl/phenylalanyl-tRNA--protein transferase